jgi:hypothetical protein
MWAYAIGKVWAAFFAAVSVVAMYVVLLTIFGRRRLILVLTFAYALGTTVWSQSSQHLLQHGFSCLMLLGAFALLLRSGGRKKFLLMCGLCVALAVAERYNNLFFAVTAAGYVTMRYYRRPAALVSFMFAPIIFGALLLLYNFHYFHNIAGGYGLGAISGNILLGLAGILFSPSRGLFVYSPFLLMAMAGIVIFIVKKGYRRYPLLASMIAVILINILLVSRWLSWWGGWSYGPRLLTEIVPLLILFIPFLIDAFPHSRMVRGTLIATIVLSIAVHAIGVFCYPNGMSNAIPVNIDKSPERLWSINGSQILVEARAGLNTEMLINCFAKITGRAKASQANGPLPDSAMSADIRLTDIPGTMSAGYSYRIPFSVINRSKVVWPALAANDGRYGISLESYWKAEDSAIIPANMRTMLWDIQPGSSWSNYVVVTAPLKKGIYRLGFNLFQIGSGWFHDKRSPPREYSITVKDKRS